MLALYGLAGVIAGAVSFVLGQSKNLDAFLHAARDVVTGDDLYAGAAADYFKYSRPSPFFLSPSPEFLGGSPR